MDDILTSIKDLLDIDAADTSFDNSVAMHINGTFSKLHILGIDAPVGVRVKPGEETTWTELLGDVDEDYLDCVKTWIYLRVRLIFDPPGNSFLVSAIQNQLRELAFDITLLAEV